MGIRLGSAPGYGFVSFFSGIGALDLGLEEAGFRCWLANELHGPFADAYAHGRAAMGAPPPVRGVLRCCVEALGDDGWRRTLLRACMGEAREETGFVGFAGGPPCPDFSVAGRGAGAEGANGRLTEAYVDLVVRERPDFFLFENVRGLASNPRNLAFYRRMRDRLDRAGYALSDDILNAVRYWVPQDRWRLMLAGLHRDAFPAADAAAAGFDWGEHAWDEDLDPFALPWPRTDAFREDGNLPLPDGVPEELTPEWWFRRNAAASHPNARHAFRPAGAAGRFAEIREGDTSGKSFKRLHRWRYSPTVAYGNNEVHLHPYKPRRLNAAEAMALQTMPPAFELPASMTLSDMFKGIGNAVPFMLAEAVGATLLRELGDARSGGRQPGAAPVRGTRPEPPRAGAA